MVAWMVLQVFQKGSGIMIAVAVLVMALCSFLIGFAVGTIMG